MPEIGPMELLVCAVVALIVFGPEKLPDMARNAGRFLNDLRRMSNEVRSEVQDVFDPNAGDDGFEPAEESETEASKADAELEAGSDDEPSKAEPSKGRPETSTETTSITPTAPSADGGPSPTEYPTRRSKTTPEESE